MREKIVTEKELEKIVQKLRAEKKKVVSTSGCFDILHAGHVMYLEQAKEHGDILIVLLNSDKSVKELKGDERPIVPEDERAQVIAGLQSVDYVCIFDDRTPCRLVELICPDAVIKGGDYRGKYIPEMDSTAKYGGKVEYVDLKEGCSSTNIIEKIKKLVGQK